MSAMKKLTSFFVKSGGDGEKKKLFTFENLIIIVVLGVIIILAGGLFSGLGGGKDAGDTAGQGQTGGEGTYFREGEDEVAKLEKRLSELLSKVEGAGNVEVMIFADSSSEVVPAYNNETDRRSDEQEGSRSTETRERRELAASGGESPVVLKVIIPEIKGVVVVAEGAGDLIVKRQLTGAVCTLLGVPEHRVQVLKHK